MSTVGFLIIHLDLYATSTTCDVGHVVTLLEWLFPMGLPTIAHSLILMVMITQKLNYRARNSLLIG